MGRDVGCSNRESEDSPSRSIKRRTNADMQAVLKQLLSCIGLSGSAATALAHEQDSDLEALLEAPGRAPQRGPYFMSSVVTVLHNLDAPKLGREDAC